MPSRGQDAPAGRRWAAVGRWLAAAALVGCASSAIAQLEPRVVAVGDVHGSLDGLSTILREAGLVDADNHWIGGSATLVQTGDLLDRGVHVRQVMDFVITLQEEATAAGGRLINLLGNHETMNLLGITRDVNRDAYATFADDRSEQRQRQGWSDYKEFWTRRMPELGLQPVFSDEAREQWMLLHPPGFLEYVEALGPHGRYGSWLRQRPAAAIVGDTLFIHGGFGPLLAGVTVDEINRRVAEELATFDRTRAWMVAEGLALPWYSIQELTREAQRELTWISHQDPTAIPAGRLERAEALELKWDSWYLNQSDGPFWFRGAAQWTDEEHGDMVARLLDGLGVARQVIGHTPQRSAEIQPRVGDRVFFIDTGMLSEVYGGKPSALEITPTAITAIYPGQRQVLVERTPATAPSQPPAP